MRITAEPRSDQINADDLVGGPMTVTIREVKPGTAEQKYDLALEGETRVWRPPLTVLRLLIACWGDDGKQWAGRQAVLYRDPDVKFGRDAVGGIRVSHVSHIDKPVTVPLTVSRGKRERFTVQPLPTSKPLVTEAQVAASGDVDELRGMWQHATKEVRALIETRVQHLQEQEVTS